MSRGGGYRGRGYGPHGHHHQRPGSDLSGGSGPRGSLRSRHSGSRQDGPGLRSSGPNSHHDGSNSHPGGSNFNQRGNGPPRGPCPNFNPPRRPPRHQNRPTDNWSPRGTSPQFQSWRGARGPRFNGPPRPFYRDRGQGQYMPRFPFIRTGNFNPPFLPYQQQVQEPKSVEKPAVPHLGSEEERQQKITEAADALKRKLSAVVKETDEWRDDDDEAIVESSQDTDHDSRIATKGIPELQHDPPELNLTLSDLRDIGRVDQEHKSEQSKSNTETDQNYEFDESEVKILAHNPVKPRIEIDLYGDDNYADYGEDESGNRRTYGREITSYRQELSSMCDSQFYNDSCIFDECENYGQESTNMEEVNGAPQQEILTMENLIEEPNNMVSQCHTKEVNAGLQMDTNRSDECDKELEVTTNVCGDDKIDAQLIIATKAPREEISATNSADAEEFHREAPIQAAEERGSENRNEERAIIDNLDNNNVNQTIIGIKRESQGADKNISVQTGENWVELSNSPQSDDMRIPGLDCLYPNEIAAQSSEESKSHSDIESAINDSNIKRNNILKSAVETAIVQKEIKETRKEVTSDNLDKTLTQGFKVEMKFDKRVKNKSVSQKDDMSRETRYETSDDRRDHNKDRAFSGPSDKVTDEAKPDAITTKSYKAVVRERCEEGEFKTRDNRRSEVSNKVIKDENRQRSKERHSKDEKSENNRLDRIRNDSSKKTDFRSDIEVAKTIDVPKDSSQNKISKSNETLSRSDKQIDDRVTDKQKDSPNQTKQERKRLVRNMTQVGSVSRSRAALASDILPNFDPRAPPPITFNKNLFSKPPPSMAKTSQDSTEIPHIPPVFDPRLSSSARNALLGTVPSIHSAIPATQDFTINQAYPPRNITNFSPIVPTINYGPRPMVPPTNVEPTANIQPICMGDPYTTLLALSNLPVAAPIVIPPDNSLLLPPLPTEPPPPLSSSRKSNIDIDDGLEDMQEAMEFAKQLMNMDKPSGTAEGTNSINSNFFHMPTFPNLPPIAIPPLPSDIPTPPETRKVSRNRQTKNNELKKNENSKQDNDSHRLQPVLEKLRENQDVSDETAGKTMDIAVDERPKVMFNLNFKPKVINQDNEWIQQQNREEAAEAAAASISRLPPSISRLSPSTSAVAQSSKEKNRSINAQDDGKKSQNVTEKMDSKTSKSNSNNSQNVEKKVDARSSNPTSSNSQNKKPEESPSHLETHTKSFSPSSEKSKQTKQPKNPETSTADSTKSENLPLKISKESTVNKSTEESPELSWKNRVIGRFLKMSKNDICNMLNNAGLRKFDIAMKHLVKERTSTLSLNKRKKEEEKLKDSEVSYNREEFMDQLSAMLDPSATVDICNLPTQFLHHLSEVLQLESMSEFGAPFIPLDNVEASTSSPTQQVAPQAPRLSRENANAREIDDRRSSKRGREKKSTNAGNAVETSVVTSSAHDTEVHKPSLPSEEPIVSKNVSKTSNIGEEVQNISTPESIRQRRRLQRQTMLEQPKTSTTAINGSTSEENSNSLNMAVLDDLFTEGIAKAKKKIVQPSKNDKNTTSSENEVNSRSNQTERYQQFAKDPSVDRVERTAVELDKIFTAGIAKAKLASRKAAAVAVIPTEANDGDDDEDDAGWRYNDDKSDTHNHRGENQSFSRHLGKCEKWNRRKAREDLDGFRNLTKEEWEAKYGETSDSTYEREYRAAMVAMNSLKNAHSPTNNRDENETFGERIAGGSNVMLGLGNIVASGSGVHESRNDSEGDRRLRNDIDNADYQNESYNNSSEDESSSTLTSSTSSQNSEAKNSEAPSVTKLLKVIKAREKVGKKRSINDEIRDEVNADIERKRRERGKVSRKGHKSRTKKSHRRKKDKKVKVREKKKRLRKRKKRRSRRSGSEDENSGDEDSDEDETSSRKQGQLLTEEEIKQEMDVVVIVKNEPNNEIQDQEKKSGLPVTAVDESLLPSVSSAPSITTKANFPAATITPSPRKTKAQLKQLPPDLLTKSAPVAESRKESPKKQIPLVKEASKEKVNKVAASMITTGFPVVEPSKSPHSISTSLPGNSNPPAIIGTENLLSKSHSKKLDFNAYKERTRLRVLRENEKIQIINENPSSLTQDLLNIPLTRKKALEKNETADQLGDQSKNQKPMRNADLPRSVISDTVVCATSKIVTSTNSAKVSTIDTATSIKTSTICKSSDSGNTNVKSAPSATNTRSGVNTANIKASAIGNIIEKSVVIKTTTTDKSSAIKTTTTDKTLTIKTDITDKNSAIETTMTDKNSAIKSTMIVVTSATETSTTAETPTISTTTTKISALCTTTTNTLSDSTTTPTISSVVDPSKVPSSESETISQSSSSKPLTRKLIRRRSVTKPPESESTLMEARVEAGKFAHIKSEGSKEMKLREKLKKGRQRVCSEGLETTIPLVHPIRLRKRPSSLVRNAEESTSLLSQQKIDHVLVKRKCDYFKKGVVSDLLPDTVPQELLPTPRTISTAIDDIDEQTDLDPLSLPIAELSSWPLDQSISTNIIDDMDTSASPPFKGFPAEPILRRDRVLTEAELNSEIDALESVSLAFEDGAADALPVSTVVDLNDLRSTGIPLNEPISYGDEEFVEGRVEIETTLLGFSVTNDIPDEPEASAALGDGEFVAQDVDRSLEKFPEESRESIDILPRVTSTLNDSPAPADFLIAEVQRPESIPSPLLVTESARDGKEESLITDFSNNHVEEKIKNLIASSDDIAEVTSSHESNVNATGDVYLEPAGPDSETSSSRITSNDENKEISFRTKVTNEQPEEASEAQEMKEKRTFLEDITTKNIPTTNSTLEIINDPPQPSSSSDSTELRGKEVAMENQRDVSDNRNNDTKTKVSSHHSHSKSRDHLHGKTKRKSSRHHHHESKSKMKGTITEKMVKEAVVSNIVKLVPKPTSKETVMARMIEIDVEIHKLMNEKMTLYKMLESGEFPAKDDGPEASSAKTNNEQTIASETEEIKETVPPTVLASRLVRDLDKTVLPSSTIVHDKSKKSDGNKGEPEDEAKKGKQKKSRQRKISEPKRPSRTATSEESSKPDATSTHSREKSTSSTEPEDAEEKNQKRRTKSLVRRSSNRRTSKRSREHSNKEDASERFDESIERSSKIKKQEPRNLREENAATKVKRKPKNLEAKKAEEKGKTQKEEKKTNVDSKVIHKNETADKKTINDVERSVIYSDESTLDSPAHEAIQGDEQREKNDSGPSTGLALLEESFKREMAETRKHKMMEKRKVKKQELRRILLDSTTVTPDEESTLKKESLASSKASKCDNTKVMKHITNVIDAVAENRIQQLYNESTSSESKDSFSEPLSVGDKEENVDENVSEISNEATEVDKDEAEESKAGNSNDSETITQAIQEENKEVDETTEILDAKITSGNEDSQETPEDNNSNDDNTKKSSEIDINAEESIERVELEKSDEKSAKQIIDDIDEPESSIKTSNDFSADKEEDKQVGIEENQSSETVHESKLIADRDRKIEETTKHSPSSSTEVKETILKTTVEPEKNLKPEDESKNEIPEEESIKESRNNLEKVSECNKERRNAKDIETDRFRSKSRAGRSAKQRNVVLNDKPSKEKKQNHAEQHNSSKTEDSKEEDAKPSSRPKSARKGRQREKSAPPSRRSSRNPDETGKTSRSKKREMSNSRGTSPYEGEPARKKTNYSRRSSSPIVQVTGNEDHPRRRVRKRKRRKELSREEMASCKVMLIDCKYSYLNPYLHPRILKKWGISRINPYRPSTNVPENSASTILNRVEGHSMLVINKVEFAEELDQSSKESRSSNLESAKDYPSSPKERPSSPKQRSLSPSERPSSPKERSSSPRDRPPSSLPKERSSSPKQPSSPLHGASIHLVPKPIPSSPDHDPSSPTEVNPPLPVELSNPVEVDVDDDEDDVFEETIQIVKVADEHVITSQSEDEEIDGVVDIIKTAEEVADVADEAANVAVEDADTMDTAGDEADVVDAVEEEADVRDTADVAANAEEHAQPPDSTANYIAVDLGNEDNSNLENFQEADTTEEVEVLGENITIVDKPTVIHVESEAQDEDIEPRRRRYTVHKGPILDIKVLDDSFLAASEDGAIYRYSQQSNGILNIYKGHEAAVTCIYVMRTGKFWKLYSGSLDGSFRCYDITTGLQERPPADVGSPVQCMDQAWGVFFVGTKSGHISRYNIKSGRIKGDRLEFSDKSVLALKASSEGPRKILIVASRNQPITIRDALTGLFLRIICGYKNHTVYSLMRERNLVYCGTSSTSIPVFDFTNGEQITQYNAGVGIVCMRLYRQILFAGCYDGNIYVFDTKETKLICSIPGPGNMLLSMEIIGDEIIAGSKDRQLHSWRMPRQVRILLADRT